MDKELRKILEKLYNKGFKYCVRGQEDASTALKDVDQAHSAILKLFKQEMLRLIGENEKLRIESIRKDGKVSPEEKLHYERLGFPYDEAIIGRNQLRAELRKKVGVDNG
jgi:hypothetical protein